MKLIEGKKISQKILSKVARSIKRSKTAPGLAVVLVGKDPASEIYVKLKKKAAEKIGVEFVLHKFKTQEYEEKILKRIALLNNDPKIHGIIVQLPLPKKFDTQKIIDAVAPKKDVDGFHPENIRRFLRGKNFFWPVFPRAVAEMIKSARKNVAGKKGIVIANSDMFGKIMTEALRKIGLRAEYVLGKNIDNSISRIRKADVVVTAVGKNGILDADMVKDGVIIIDGGIVKKEKNVTGDVDVRSFENKNAYLSPVPGGVGPVTIACLLENVYKLFLMNRN